ncbi:MAG: hypothetical protein LBP88_04695, partial [Treponema sp.]|nr:hypothetical protein [Treponema sp.]
AVTEIEKLLGAQQAKDTDAALGKAKERLDWATSVGAKSLFPEPYTRANTAYNDGVKAKTAKNWADAAAGAAKVIAAVTEIEKLLEAQQAKDTDAALSKAKERLDWATSVGAKGLFPEPYTRASTAYNDGVKAKTAKNWTEAAAGAAKTIAAVGEIEKLLEAQQAKDTDAALSKAKERLDWATSVGAKGLFPEPYTQANTAYNDGVKAKTAKNWTEAAAGAAKTIAAVTEIENLLEAQQAKDTDAALSKAKERLDWATSVGAKGLFPEPYTQASTGYNDGVKAKTAKNWADAAAGATKAIAAVTEIEKLLEAQQAKDTDAALSKAKERLDWATSVGAKGLFPEPYTQASTAYNNGVKAKTAKNWDEAAAGAAKTIAAVTEIENLMGAQQAKDTDAVLSKAKERLDWAASVGAKSFFPEPYTRANTAYNDAVKAKTAKNWDEAAAGAAKTIAAVGEIEKLLAAQQAKDTDAALSKAKERLDWAASVGAKSLFPEPYTRASTAYNDGVKAKTGKNWNEAVAGAAKVIVAVGEIEKLMAAQQAKDTDAALSKAKERLDWAASVGAKGLFPEPYTQASTAYNDGVKAKTAKNWNEAAAGAAKTIAAVGEIEKLMEAQQAKDTDAALSKAKERLDWAASVGAKSLFPEPYTRANTAYNDAMKAKTAKNWDEARAGADKVLAAVAEIDALNQAAQLRKAQEADRIMAAAQERLDWAASIGADTQFQDTFMAAQDAYAQAFQKRLADDLDGAIAAAEQARRAVARIDLWKREETNGALVAAKERLDWAAAINAETNFPDAYGAAQAAYAEAVQARTVQDWEKTLAAANRVLELLAPVHEISPLPAQYRIRTWLNERDCLWNIAGYPWVYNDPSQWGLLYEANRSKLPDINDPNFVLPEIILDIPRIQGEIREGLWEENRSYGALP